MKSKLFFLSLAAIVLFASGVFAKKHVIQFQNYSYAPNTLTVAIGDTVEWDGSFISHPLVADQFPTGATKFDNVGSGSSFQYVVTVAGTYNYSCLYHKISHNMFGSFTTQANAVPPVVSTQAPDKLYVTPNPSSSMVMIDYSVNQSGAVRLSITTIDGKQVSLLVDKVMQAGDYMEHLDISKFASGTYIVTLEADGQYFSKEMVVTK